MEAVHSYRILIVKIGAIGDAVMALPMLGAIRKKWPHAHISWVAGSTITALIEATDLVDQVIKVDEKKIFQGTFLTKTKSILVVWLKVGFYKFDLVLTLHPDPRYKVFSFLTRCFVRKKFSPTPGIYHAREYLKLLETEIQTHKISFPHFYLPKTTFLQNFLHQISGQISVVLCPGGAKNILADDSLRRWPIRSYVALASYLLTQNITVIITGSGTDQWILNHFSKETGIYNLVNKLCITDWIALLKHVSLLITHDSGPLHIGKLAKCPTIGLFGPTNPKEKTSPEEDIECIWGGSNLLCRPCYNGKIYAQCLNNVCLSQITPEAVFQTALKKIGKRF